MSGALDRQLLERAFAMLADRLRRRAVVAHVYVVGGAAMVMAYHAERATRDVDALILEGHGPVLDAAAGVAHDLDLPRSWLNEQASAYIPPGRDEDARTIVDHPNLKVTAASPRLVMAMKVRASRPRDVIDLHLLADLIGVEGVEGVVAVHDEVFVDDPLPQRTLERLRTYWE